MIRSTLLSSRRSDPWKGLLAGLAGGAAGTIAMSLFQALAQRAEPDASAEDSEPYDRPRHPAGNPRQEPGPTAKVADRLATTVRRPLSARQREVGGQVVHYGFGTSVGGGYGMLAEVWPEASLGRGLAFGAALMVLADEVAVPALRLSPPPARVPWPTHAYALAAHLVYGFVTEEVRRAVRGRL